jgi:hypothetical protein
MTTINHKLVVCFDKGTSTYKPSAHNLNAEQAVEHVKSLEADHIQSRVLDQKRNHSGHDPKKCRACLDTAKKITEEHNTRSADPQQQPAVSAASAEPIEGD